LTGIYFDIDDTLYSRKALLLQAAEETRQAAGDASDPVPDPEVFMRLFNINSDTNLKGVESGEISPRDSNVWRYEKTLQDMGILTQPGEGDAFADRYAELQKNITMSDVLESLFTQLSGREDIRLGILTNGETSHQWRKYGMLRLERYIDRGMVIVSGETGLSKPEPSIFHLAEQRMGLGPGRLVMVGDSLRNDILPAKKLGWRCVWYDRSAGTGDSVKDTADSVDLNKTVDMIVRTDKELKMALI